MRTKPRRIDWDVIRDDTQVAVDAPPSFADPEDFWQTGKAASAAYRVDRQEGQPVHLELWAETAGMDPQLV